MAFRGGAKSRLGVKCLAALGAFSIMTLATAAQAQAPGSQPQIHMSRAIWNQSQSNPGFLQGLSANLPPVAAEPGPSAGPPLADPPTSGTWSNLASNLGFNVGNPLLMTDGTVIVHRTDTGNWWKLTPDINGSYINGTWSSIASMQSGYAPKFFASAVLTDGRVIVEGGEYNNGSANWGTIGSLYDPVANTWTAVSPPSGWTTIGDAQSTLLANGTFMLADCCSTKAALFNPASCCTSSAWTATGTGKNLGNDEESWTLLPDGTVLTVDAYWPSGTGCSTTANGSERYSPNTGAWTSAGTAPSQLADCNTTNTIGTSPTFEIGPAALMYNGKVIAFGGTTKNTAHTALYDTSNNTWAAGPDLPTVCNAGATACDLGDAPAVVLPTGNVLFAANHGYSNSPAKFFEYDPTGNSFAAVNGTADAASIAAFYVNFLILPTGQVFAAETYTSTVQIYTPSGSPVSAAKPVITSLSSTTLTPGSTYTVNGTQLNGLTQGAYFGDDQQAATNYPIVRITNNSSGHVFYAKTSNFSSMTVASGASGSSSFKVAAGTETGASTLVVIANGIASSPTSVTVGAATAALTVSPNTALNFYGPVGGPFANNSFGNAPGQFTLSNTGGASLNYSISAPSWLNVSSTSGTIAGGASTSVTVTPGPSAVSAGEGNSSSTIAFTNTTNGAGNTSVSTGLLVFRSIEASIAANLAPNDTSVPTIGGPLPRLP